MATTKANELGQLLGTTIPISLGSAGQVLTVNSGATAGEWTSPAGGADLYAANESSPTAQPSATGTNAIAIGDNTTATGTSSFALGLGDGDATGTRSFAVGGAANGNESIAIMKAATANGYRSVSIGHGTGAGGSYSVALGNGAQALVGSRSIAIGQSLASGAGSFAAAIGTNTNTYGALGPNSVAIGQLPKATQANSIAIGDAAISTTANQIALGGATDTVKISNVYTLPTADGTSGQVMTTNGSGVISFATAGGGADLYAANESSPSAQPSATGGNAIAIGDGATASSNDSVAIGLNAQATYFVSVAIGENSTASGNRALALGRTSTASGNYSTAMGLNSGVSGPYATGDGSMAFGSSRATGIDSFAVAIGNNTTSYGAQGADGISIGKLSKVTNTRTTAVGEYAFATHSEGAAFGYLARATNNYSLALGARSVSSSTATVALSFESEASAYGSVAIGILSKSTASHSTAFASSRASGSHSFSAGITNNTTSYGASGANSIAIGYQAKATSTKSLAIGGSSNSSTGNYSSVIGGASSSASGVGSFAMGFSCIADADYSYAKGDMGKTNGILHKHAVGLNNGQQGANYLLGHTTSDATPIALNTQIWTPSASNQITLQDYTAFIFSGTVVAREKGSTGTDVGAWEVKGVIRRESGAGTTVLVNSVINEINVPTGWEINLTADTSFGCLKVEATGAASTSIKWLATIKTAEVTYA